MWQWLVMGHRCCPRRAAEMHLQPAEAQQPTWQQQSEQEQQDVPAGVMYLPGACLDQKDCLFEL